MFWKDRGIRSQRDTDVREVGDGTDSYYVCNVINAEEQCALWTLLYNDSKLGKG